MQAQTQMSTTYSRGILDDVAPLILFASMLLLVSEPQIVPLIDIQELPELTAVRSLP